MPTLSSQTNEQSGSGDRFEDDGLERWFEKLLDRFDFASGGAELNENQMAVTLDELRNAGFTPTQAALAESWILRGWPCKKGKIVLADFYPRAKDLAEAGIVLMQRDPDAVKLFAEMERRVREAYHDGYAAGEMHARRQHLSDDEHLRLVERTIEITNYRHRKLVLVAREKGLDDYAAVLENKRRELMRIERRLSIFSHLSPTPMTEDDRHPASRLSQESTATSTRTTTLSNTVPAAPGHDNTDTI